LRVTKPRPNPFNARVEIAFEIRATQKVDVTVFDVRGRRVRDLVGSNRPAGNYRASWDGTNENGRSVPAGVYFIRLETEGQQRTRKVLLRR